MLLLLDVSSPSAFQTHQYHSDKKIWLHLFQPAASFMSSEFNQFINTMVMDEMKFFFFFIDPWSCHHKAMC